MSFCYSPWTNIDIDPSGSIRPCCKIISDNYDIHHHTLTEYKNSKFLNNLKQQFIAGVKPSECERCWREENSGIKSKRLLDFDRWGEYYNSYDTKTNKILTISLGMGNVCNLKCRICSSNASSKWIKEEKEYTGVTNKIYDFYKNQEFIDQVKNILSKVIHIDFPGGEPLVAGTTQQMEILDHLIASGQARYVSLHYTSNLTLFPDSDLWERWKHFRNVDLQFSIDGINEHFEYNRHPSVWNIAYSNLKKYQEKEKELDNIQISIAHTLSVFTIYYLPEFYNWCIDEGLPEPWIGRLHEPIHYQPGVFPKKAKDIVYNKLSKHQSSAVSSWKNEVFDNDASEHLSEFWDWIDKVDSYRNENFNNTFSEIAKLLRLSC